MQLNKRTKAVLGAVLFIALTGFVAFAALTTIPVRVLGPFYTSPQPFDSALGNQVGGHIQTYLAADSCRIGQVVVLKTARSVAPSTTFTDYNRTIGVVVGGTRTSMQASLALADTSTLAATANQKVLVLDEGRYWVLDSGAVGPGLLVTAAVGASLTTTGRLKIAPSVPDSFSRIVGRTVDTLLIGKAGLVQIRIR